MFSLFFVKLLIYGSLLGCTASILLLLISFKKDKQKGDLW